MNIDSLREFCLALPSATEDVKWDNDLVFSIGGKMFCIAALQPSPFNFSFKVTDDEFEELSIQPGFMPAPYMARAKWVLLSDPAKLNKKESQEYILNSYELVKAKLTKKLRSKLGIER